ncbi:hypothetical protein AVEN_212427-1 [Araneus ventricosus]|uniref:Uncharacterized protein n=1 Tax=Araneus ventricosus TaxID=182803 RepID=A0A4Y2RZS0_ARAVE|nr:hypothetical protein AVEN_212427-1 [Araneus ventricosus]
MSVERLAASITLITIGSAHIRLVVFRFPPTSEEMLSKSVADYLSVTSARLEMEGYIPLLQSASPLSFKKFHSKTLSALLTMSNTSFQTTDATKANQ